MTDGGLATTLAMFDNVAMTAQSASTDAKQKTAALEAKVNRVRTKSREMEEAVFGMNLTDERTRDSTPG